MVVSHCSRITTVCQSTADTRLCIVNNKNSINKPTWLRKHV